MAQPADLVEPSVLDELDADVHDAHDALQALMALLCGCDPAQTLAAGQLRGLLQPIAGSVAQAAHTLQAIGR